MQKIRLSDTELVKGSNTGIYGAMKVGKSHLTKILALNYYLQGKPVFILDHNFNDDTYGDFWGIQPEIISLEQFTSINWAFKSRELVVRVQRDNPMADFDFNAFFAYAGAMKYNVFILDDLGDIFGNQATTAIKNFPATTVNNYNEVFYQFHNLFQAHPFLRGKLQNIVLKSLPIDSTIPEDFLTPSKIIRACLREIEAENKPLPFKKKFAWRYLHADDQLITMPEKLKIDGSPEKYVTYLQSEYFENKL
ncbi:ATP-binding protein [Emticicia sp. 17c]|uniref:ATP-binding protein n=1 Tax=Emticicia sp. 17c TaxID=3127704 RepID=UPI00301D0B10